MPRRKNPIAGLAQPRALVAKTVRKELKLTPDLAKATAAAARAAGQTWTMWTTLALEAAVDKGGTR